MPKDENSYQKMRLSEILVTFYHHFDLLDEQMLEQESNMRTIKDELQFTKSQL